MSFFTRQAKSFQENFKTYLVLILFWIVCSLLLLGFTRQAWEEIRPVGPKLCFASG